MTWREQIAHYRPGTLLVVEIAEQFLQDHFGHAPAAAAETLAKYFASRGKWIDEAYVHHEGPWGIATAAEYLVHVQGEPGEIFLWRRDKRLLRAPEEAMEYMRRHYWNRNRPRGTESAATRSSCSSCPRRP